MSPAQTTPTHPMHGTILFAHGSRDPLWRQPIEAIAAKVRQLTPDGLVRCAYLELTEPDLATAAAELVQAGAASLTVVPLFLGVGRHAREDLPVLMDDLRQRYPEVTLTLKAAVGEDPQVIELLATLALQT